MRADPVDLAAFHDENAVGVLDGRRTLRDDDLRRFGDIFLKRLADERVGFGIDR